MPSEDDHMSGLPLEVKEIICAHLADLLDYDPRARREALAGLRLTTRTWLVAPCVLLFRSLRVDVWGSRGLENLFKLSSSSDIFRHVRNLTVHVNLDIDTTMHPNYRIIPGKPNLAARAMLIPIDSSPSVLYQSILAATELSALSVLGYKQSYIAPPQARLLKGLAELFGLLLSTLRKLDAVRIENASPLALNRESSNRNSAVSTWFRVSYAVNSALVNGLLDSRSYVKELLITGHPVVFKELRSLLSERIAHSSTSSSAMSRLTKLQLHYIHSDCPRVSHAYYESAASLREFYSIALNGFTHLLDLDIGRSPLDSGQPVGYPDLAPFARTDFPRLRCLTLRYCSIDTTEELATFLNQRIPELEQLRLGNTTIRNHQCWWTVFGYIREKCKLKRFRLVGSRLFVDFGGIQWYVGARGDPRPQDRGDSIEHADLEAWITGADVPNPRELLVQPGQRVMVWNAENGVADSYGW